MHFLEHPYLFCQENQRIIQASFEWRYVGPRPFPDWPLTNELDEQNILKPLRGHRWCTYDTENLIPEFEKALRRRYE